MANFDQFLELQEPLFDLSLKNFKMAWRPYFSYSHDEIRHVNYKYAKNSCRYKKTVKKLDVCDLSEFHRFQFSSLGIKILSKKKIR